MSILHKYAFLLSCYLVFIFVFYTDIYKKAYKRCSQIRHLFLSSLRARFHLRNIAWLRVTIWYLFRNRIERGSRIHADYQYEWYCGVVVKATFANIPSLILKPPYNQILYIAFVLACSTPTASNVSFPHTKYAFGGISFNQVLFHAL